MKLLYTLILLIITKAVIACSCSPMPGFKSIEDLKDYDFIALAKIRKLAPLDTSDHWMHTRINGEIEITVAELFKGKNVNIVNDPSFKNNCVLEVAAGEEWLFFGRMVNGKMTVGRCDYNTRYRDTDGGRNWYGFSGIKQLQLLRSLYWHKPGKNVSGSILYANGKTEIEQNFKNGLLDGVRKIYYPDGKIYITEEFENGVRTGFGNYYGRSGQLLLSVKYEDNLKKEQVAYQDTTENAWYLNFQAHNSKKDLLFGESEHDSIFFEKKLDFLRRLNDWAKQIRYIYTYSNQGRSYKRAFYNYLGNLEAESYLDWDKQITEYHRYNKSGKLETYSKYDQVNDQQVEYDYKEDGTRRDFVDKCRSCIFYFGVDLPPAAAPEEIYIQ